jgi:hypothetical protein
MVTHILLALMTMRPHKFRISLNECDYQSVHLRMNMYLPLEIDGSFYHIEYEVRIGKATEINLYD